jgi:hypothetical protein
VVATQSDSTIEVFCAFSGVPITIGVRVFKLRKNYRQMDLAVPTLGEKEESHDEEKALLEDFPLQHPALTEEPPFHTCMIHWDTQKVHLDAINSQLNEKYQALCKEHIYVSVRRRPASAIAGKPMLNISVAT